MPKRTILITGGTSGIGKATVFEFYDNGDEVIFTGRDENKLKQVAAEMGAGSYPYKCDVSDLSEIDGLYSFIKVLDRKIDVLFINAGIGRWASLQDTTEALFDEVVTTNFKGAYFTLQRLIPLLQDNAVIIINASVSASIGRKNQTVYAATKAALVSLAKTASAELIDRGIRVNIISPGLTDTPAHGVKGVPESMYASIPLKRPAHPDEIAKAVLFLASPAASFMVGEELLLDGGVKNLK